MQSKQPKIHIKHLSFSYGSHQVLKDLNIRVEQYTLTALVGASGSGKSTFLTVINRLWETQLKGVMSGSVEINLDNRMVRIYEDPIDLTELRRKAGMVFQVPNPLPMSIWKNMAFPLKLKGIRDRTLIGEKIEKALRMTHIWHEVKDRLDKPSLSLSVGQQQRLCFARTLVLEPEVLLLDEPTSSLDERSRDLVENLMIELKSSCTLLVVSHYMDQVRRISDHVFELAEGQIQSLRE